MGERARATAAEFTTQRTMQTVYEIVTGRPVTPSPTTSAACGLARAWTGGPT
jgi:hypothetical protein